MPEFSVMLPNLLQRLLIGLEISRTVSMVRVLGRPYSPATAAIIRAAQSFRWPGQGLNRIA